MRLLSVIGVVATFSLLGCLDAPNPRIICHNSNCVEPTNPDADDTLDALEASLALVEDGSPLFDGMEIDTFWSREQERCIFAHDVEQLDAEDAARAVDVLLDWFDERAGQNITRSASFFTVMIELKGHVAAAKTDKHTADERAAHIDCVLDMAAALEHGATLHQRDLELIFTTFDPVLLSELGEKAEIQTRSSESRLTVKLGALQGIPKPLDPQTQALADFGDVDLIHTHPQWLRDGAWQAMRSMGVEVGFWMFQATSETLEAIELYRPDLVNTSEAQFMHRWLSR